MKYNYKSFVEIPPSVVDFLKHVSEPDGFPLETWTLDEINQILNELDDWYSCHDLHIGDFVS